MSSLDAPPAAAAPVGGESDLLVFGYSCRLFRDDARAGEVHRGEQLIPWMGRQDVLIDRYDGRGHLFSLEEHEGRDAPEGSAASDCAWEGMSAMEAAEEQACQEERLAQDQDCVMWRV